MPFIRQRARGAILLIGPPGSGKSTALRHLRAVLSDDARVTSFDEPDSEHWHNVAHDRLAIVASRGTTWFPLLATFTLAKWTEDDCLEYLASAHRQKCPTLLPRIIGDESLPMLGGCPQLLRAVLDRMAADPTIASISDAIRRDLWDVLPPGVHRNTATNVCMVHIKDQSCAGANDFASKVTNEAIDLLRHPPVQQVLCADAIATMLCEGHVSDHLHRMLSREMVRQLAAAVRLRPAAFDRLNSVFYQSNRRYDAMAASILLAVDPKWRPRYGRRLLLRGALLDGAQWSELDLSETDLVGARLALADLRLANLTKARLQSTDLAGANLRSASLDQAHFWDATLSCADLSYAHMERAEFLRSDLTGASFQSASLSGASFQGAMLRQANFGQADLSDGNLVDVDVEDADFSDADLTNASLARIKMFAATWTHAKFTAATLQRCNLQDLELPGANFEAASLRECDLTGTRIPGGNFRGARLCGAGLADIHWEGADLRDADFTYASFHMGSTRCGLVGSDIPCEGSKTGFYTDDYDEHDHLPPEEIRKANLCGADLRGAKVFDTDFYLVDLRGAKYSSEQEEHFAKCRAILHSRVA